MIRLESFDCLNAHKRKILRILEGREFTLREITDCVGSSRSTNWRSLQVMERAGLVIPKKSYKKQWFEGAKKLQRDVVHWCLVEEGRDANIYFRDFKEMDGEKKHD
jgi:hypothetical protein